MTTLREATKCESPLLEVITRRLHRHWADDERQLLKPLIPRLVSKLSTPEHAMRGAYVLVDAAIREITPLGIEAVGWHVLAMQIRALAPIMDRASAREAQRICGGVFAESHKRTGDHTNATTAHASASYAAAARAAAACHAAASYVAHSAASYASYAAASASSYAALAATLSPEKGLRAQVRRPIIEATVRACERAIKDVAG